MEDARELKLLRDIESLVKQRHILRSALEGIMGIDDNYCDSCRGRAIGDAFQIASAGLNAHNDMLRDGIAPQPNLGHSIKVR